MDKLPVPVAERESGCNPHVSKKSTAQFSKSAMCHPSVCWKWWSKGVRAKVLEVSPQDPGMKASSLVTQWKWSEGSELGGVLPEKDMKEQMIERLNE